MASVSRAKSVEHKTTNSSSSPSPTPNMDIPSPRRSSRNGGIPSGQGVGLLDRRLREASPPNITSALANDRYSMIPENDPRLGDMVSPFETDRVLKNGWLHKRNKAKQWGRRWFVLRDHQLVYYKDEQEYKVEGIISTADIMTVAMVTDQHKPNHFMIFTSSSNFHLRADNAPDAQDWCDVIHQVADDSAESLLSSSFRRMNAFDKPFASGVTPSSQNNDQQSSLSHSHHHHHHHHPNHHPQNKKELEGIAFPKNFAHSNNHNPNNIDNYKNTNTFSSSSGFGVGVGSPGTTEFSGAEDAGMSSCTSDHGQDAAATAAHPPPLEQEPEPEQVTKTAAVAEGHEVEGDPSLSQEEKIIKKGYLLRLKKRYNQWKRQYVILTTQRVVAYKSEKHKEPIKVIALRDIIDVVEIDPLSRSKQFCMMLITAEKRLRFCAQSEEDLTKWLASLKSLAPSKRES